MTLADHDAMHPNFDHRALLHQGPDDLARRLTPTLADALDRDEPVLLSLHTDEWTALRDHVGPTLDAATTLPAPKRYANPANAMNALHDFIRWAVDQGAESVWSVGAIGIEGDLHLDARWIRYESAVESVLGPTPLRGICAYDATTAPEAVLDAVARCHRALDVSTPELRRPQHRPYDHGSVDWLHRSGPPAIATVATGTSEVRQLLASLVGGSLPPQRLSDLQLVATELVTNGIRHGTPPVELRVWDTPTQVVIEVLDSGPGIADHYADLRPRHGGVDGGFGMWLVGQFSDQVSIGREGDRTVVLATVRRPRR